MKRNTKVKVKTNKLTNKMVKLFISNKMGYLDSDDYVCCFFLGRRRTSKLKKGEKKKRKIKLMNNNNNEMKPNFRDQHYANCITKIRKTWIR